MSKIIIFILFVFLVLLPNQVKAACSEELYDSKKPYQLNDSQCRSGDCLVRSEGGGGVIRRVICWPAKIQSTEPTTSEPKEVIPVTAENSQGHGTCEYKKREGIRALPNENPPGYILVKDECDSGYKPALIKESTSFRCACVPEGAQVCQAPNGCIEDSECQKNPGCQNYTCVGVIKGRTPGRCVNQALSCSNNNADCSSDADCRKGDDQCASYYCWPIGNKGAKCQFGPPPTNPPKCSEEDYKTGKCSSAGGIPCGSDQDPAIATAIGCIHTSPAGFVKDAMRFIIAISGGLAFLMMLLGAFQMLTSAGNPETLAAGKDRLQSAIIGLLLVLFSTLLLRIIGLDILGIPGF